MTVRRIEAAPLALYTLAAGALLLSFLAIELRTEDPARPKRRAARDNTALTRPVFISRIEAALPQRSAEPYRPALAALASVRSDYVHNHAARYVLRRLDPSATLSEAQPAGELVVLVPKRPQWTAGRAAFQQALAGTALDFWHQIGKAIAALGSRSPSTVDPSDAIDDPSEAFLSVATPRSEPSTPRVIVGPNDRLAMAPVEENVLSLPDDSEAFDLTPIQIEDEDADHAFDLESEDFFLLLDRQSEGFQPAVLLTLLRKLEATEEASEWAATVLREVDFLLCEQGDTSVDFAETTKRLSLLAEQGRGLANEYNGTRIAVLLRKASYAIDRRVHTWRIAQRIVQHDVESRDADSVVPRKASAVKPWRFASVRRDAWRRHLAKMWKFDTQVRTVGETETEAADLPTQAALASQALKQLGATHFRLALLCLISSYAEQPVVEPSDSLVIGDLLGDLEAYEVEPRPELAHRIAMRRIELKNSNKQDHAKLAAELDRNYRNANLRIAISQQLLTRQLPHLEPSSEPVSDYIAGAPVHGAAQTDKSLAISLTPDPHAWRFAVIAHGRVNSNTVAMGGPARLRTHGVANFTATKPIRITASGVTAYASTCQTSSSQQLVGMDTRFDGIPLVEDFVRTRAQDEYRQRQGRARRDTELRIESRVTTELDRESDRMLQQLQRRYREDLLGRAHALGLEVDPIEVRTTNQRLIARVRLAGADQLAAHTPRNRAPADSLASFQVHESMINNALDGLDLASGPMTPAELREKLREKLAIRQAQAEVNEEHQAVLTFSQTEPARVRLNEGVMRLVLSFDQLTVDDRSFRNFRVHAVFLPQASTQGVWLVQNDPVQIEGRMRAIRRANLHGVFGQIMPAGKRFTIAQVPAEQESRLAGLMVTQVVVDDGWLGMALGPRSNGRVALKARFIR